MDIEVFNRAQNTRRRSWLLSGAASLA